MNRQPVTSLDDLPDLRVQADDDHVLIDIVLIAVCAVLRGAKSWREVEEFGRANEAWLRLYLQLPAGIPSHETFGQVFQFLDVEDFQRSFMTGIDQHVDDGYGQVIAVEHILEHVQTTSHHTQSQA